MYCSCSNEWLLYDCDVYVCVCVSSVMCDEVRPKWRAAKIVDLPQIDTRLANMKIAAAAAIVGSASAWSTLTMKANPRNCSRESFLVACSL